MAFLGGFFSHSRDQTPVPLKKRMAPETHWMAMKTLSAVCGGQVDACECVGRVVVQLGVWKLPTYQSTHQSSWTDETFPSSSNHTNPQKKSIHPKQHAPAQSPLSVAGWKARRRPMQTKLASHMVTVEKVQSSPPMMMPFTG